MKDFYLKGKMVEITPVAVYENVIYTQDITFELENGINVEVDDSFKKCGHDMIGKEMYVKLHASVVHPIIKKQENEMKIVPLGKDMGPHANIHARIEEIIKTKPEWSVVLDVGIGKIVLYADEKQINLFYEKDYIIAKGARLYLDEMSE